MSNDDEGAGGELSGSEQEEDESDAFPLSLEKKVRRSLSKDRIEKRSQEKEEKEEKRDRYKATGVAVAGGEEPRRGFRSEGKMWN